MITVQLNLRGSGNTVNRLGEFVLRAVLLGWLSPSPAASSAVSTCSLAKLPGNRGPVNSSEGLFPVIRCMKSIQIGNAALAPTSPLPRVFFWSYPIQTPQVREGVKPINQASV